MKKTFLTLSLSLLLISGTSFASFHVDKSSNKTESIVLNQEVSENLDITAEKYNDTVVQEESTLDSSIDGGDNNMVAIILAVVSVLLLPFAFHNWYLGKKKKALWQTLMVFPGFILLGLPALASWIWQVIDLITLLLS